jgi:hypothetical protein
MPAMTPEYVGIPAAIDTAGHPGTGAKVNTRLPNREQ